MGKKVKKKSRSGQKEKRVVTTSLKTVSQQSIPSIETIDEVVSVVKERKACPHLDKGIDLVKVSSKFGDSGLLKCEDCREDVVDRRAGKGKGKHGKKKGGGSVDSKLESKAIWICLECGHFSCGGAGFPTTPQSHAVRHARQYRHPLVVQFENPHLRWCFPCSTLIPVENSVENGEPKDVLFDIVKMIKGPPPDAALVNIEDVWFGTGIGSVISEVKSENTIASILHGRGGYVVRGLVNLGNTCFFNSTMQNILAMDKLRDYFFKLDGSVGPLTSALKNLFIEASPEAGLRSVINPKSFFGCVCAKAPQFRGYQQHDSHELLRCLLDGLSIEDLSVRKQNKSSDEDGTSPNSALTYVDAIFGGQLSSTVTCLECGHSSVVCEPFLDLSLPVPTKRPPSKKAQPVSRAKKPKLPPKRSGRIRSKVNRIADPIPGHVVTNTSAGGKFCQVESSAPVAEKFEASSGDSRPVESIDQSVMGDNKGSVSQDLSATQGFESKQFFENVTEKTAVSLENSTWLDYLEPGTVSDDHDMSSTIDDSVTQGIGNNDAVQNDVLLQNTFESSRQVQSVCTEETTSSSLNLTWLDYLEPDNLSVDPDMASELNDISVIQDSGNKDAVLNDDFLGHSSENCSQVCSKESNLKMDYPSNSWEDEPPLQVQGSEIILLPYKEDTSTTVDILRGEDDVRLSPIGCEQDPLDFDGFGDLFNEPEVVAGPTGKPLTGDNTSEATEVVETDFMVGNSSGSDPDEVDNTDSPVSVESCLAYFTKPELLSKSEHAWHCENCSKALRGQRMRSRKKLQKPILTTLINGGDDRVVNSSLGLGKDCSFPIGVRTFCNENSKTDVLRSDESLASHSGKIDSDYNRIPETNQKAEPNLLASQLEEGKGERSDAVPELSGSSSWSKTCSQESFSCQASDSCSVNEPGYARCSTDKVQQRESQVLDRGHESQGSEDEEMDSDSVKVKRDATKRILINKVPPILTIHLKRFSQDARGHSSKLKGHVDFRDTIDLGPYMDPRCTERDKYKYRLVGVVEHLGSMRGGHYVAYVRGGAKSTGKDERENGDTVWYHASDAYVREASFEEVLRCEAYILFYEEI